MSFTVENLEKNMAKLTIEVSAEDFEKALQGAYEKNKGKIAVNGFRKGKVPRQMIEKVYGAGIFYEDAANALIPGEYAKAAAECGLDIVSQPEIDITQIEKGSNFIFTATVALKPEVTLGDYLGVEIEKGQKSIYEVLIGEIQITEAIYPSVLKKLDVIPSNVDLAAAEVDLVYLDNREKILKEALNSIKSAYDYIFIDCPPSLGLLTVNALTATDTIIIPIQCEYLALVGLGQLMNTVRLIKKHLNPNIDIEGVLLTMKVNRSNLVNQVGEEIRKYFGSKVYETYIPRNIRLAESPSHGKPILLYDGRSKGAFAYKALAEEFLSKQ